MNIWCNAQFSGEALAELKARVQPHQFVISTRVAASNLVAGAPDPALAEADVAFGQPDPKSVIDCSRLKWVHINSAGYTRYDTPEFRSALTARGAAFTNSSMVYAEPCAEHALAFMMAEVRQFAQSVDTQRSDRSWPTAKRRLASRLLVGQSVVMLGYGAIGRRLAELLVPFRMRITALRRKASEEAGVQIIGEAELPAALADADHVVNILPENPGTRSFVDARFLAAMKPGAVFYNIGRGATVDQGALVAALESRRLAAAYLDVTSPEPLPPDHALWTAPNCYITPHTAGGHDTEDAALIRHFVDNLARFESGEPLLDRVI